SGGGHGIDITGDSATVINKGNITVTDKDSVGVLINGDRATFANTGHIDVNNSATGMSITTSEGAISQAGSMNVGDFSTGMALSGNNNSVTLAAKDLNVIGQKATGVNISGDNNAVDITGNILVDKDQTATNAVDYFYEPSIGVNVSGNSNTVSLDGKLTVVADSELTSRIYADFDGSQENISGLVVSGDDNTVYLNGGIQLVGEENQLTDGSTVASNRNGYGKTPVITVDGKSSVYLNGDSTINGDLPLAYSGMIRLKNSAMIEIGADATINMQVDIYDHYARSESQMIFVESGAELVNKGDIDTRNIGFAAISGENSTGSNSGNITLSQYNYGLLANAGVGYFTTKGGSAVNNGTITAKVMEQESVINLGASLGLNEANTFYSDANSMMGLDAFDHGYVSNESGGSIEMYSSDSNNASMMEIYNTAVFNNSGDFILNNSRNAIHLYQSGSFYNTGHMLISGANYSGNAINYWNANNNGRFINSGTVDVTAKALATSGVDASTNHAYFWNQNSGIVNFDKDSGVAVKFTHSNYVAQNDGTMNISGNNAIAMEGNKNAQLINNGTINLGAQGTTDTGMIGMQLDSSATADAVIENNGTINIYANNSFAFSMLGSVGHLVNNGTVTIADGVTGSGLIKQGNSVNIEGVNGNNGNNSEVHYANYTLPDVPGSSVFVSTDNVSDNGGQNNLNGYVVGTSSDGSAGKLKVSNASLKGVSVNTGFTSGTSATSVTFDNVVQGNNLTDADTITSTSVVWSAQGNTDANGNVDVTMTKNAYTDVVTDSSVNNVAQVLDTGYTNNDLYTSLNVGTTAELNSALKQISGSQATTVFNEARVLSNRFSMLSDAAPEVANGLAFNVVAKGDPRAELGNDTQYDMMALRKSLTLTEHQNLSLEYGIARLEGNGSDTAGDNGVTGGYSQLFGLKHQMAFDNGMNWNNALRYDVHQLDSSRSIAYGDVNKTADANVKQQYLEFRSEGAKTFELREGLNVTPYAGVKLRHTLEGGYQERNAGDFNLSMNSGSETAVDSIVGLKLDYAGKEGWSANATLEGGPNLSYVKSQRTASISGAGSQRFNIDDGQSGGGFNSLATMGVKYSSQESALQVDAFHWKEDGISDKGVMLNFKKTF
ncbi:autotransporter domain-containing protein, partial [Escherichia coli]|nr:autotransporter domain-containing protein [Escherichia coli]